MPTQSLRRSAVVVFLISLICPLLVQPAFAAGTASRIGAIRASETATLAGSAHPMAKPEFDKGAVQDAMPLSGLALNFQRSAAQQASLEALIAAQNDPGSPQFHQWLTPEQFAASYGMSTDDIAKATAWLQSQGFAVVKVADSGNAILFSGTAGQVRNAFGTEIHHYQVHGVTHYANASAVTLPAALALVVSGVSGLDDFKPTPKSSRARAAASSAADVTALFTSGISGNHYLTPGDFSTIYDVKPLYSGGFTGMGETIGVAGQTDIVLSDVTAFRAAAGLPVNNPTVLLIQGSGDPGISYSDLPEADLDLEWAGGIAYNANIVFLNSTNAFNSVIYGIQNRVTVNSSSVLLPILSISYGLCEPLLSSTTISTMESAFVQAASQGQTVIAAAGDNGAADCDTSSYISTQGKAVDYPASSAYVTGIGGTEFNEGTTLGGTSYWTSNGSTDVVSSAKSYIPEEAWDDTPTSTLSYYYDSLLGGGGGASVKFAKPSWQTGVANIPVDGARDVPDISLSGSPVHDAYLVCTQVQLVSTGSYAGSCGSGFRVSDGTASDNTDLTAYGGTSLGAPSFAGVLALIEQKLGSQQGTINKALYTMASNSTTYASAFHDITVGSNVMPCSGGTGCVNGLVGYYAGTGYDQATGLGSIDASNLATAFASYAVTNGSKVGTTVTLGYQPTTPTIGQVETFTANVTPNTGSGTPMGTVTFSVDGIATGAAVQLVAGAASTTYSFSTGGTHTVIASYSGDTGDYASLSPTLTLSTFNDAAGALTTNTTLTDGNVTTVSLYATSGPAYTATVTAASGTIGGTVTFTVGTGTSAVSTTEPIVAGAVGVGTATLPATAVSAATGYTSPSTPVTAHYNGTTAFKQSTSNQLTLTTANPVFTIPQPATVTATSTGLNNTATTTVTVTSVGGFTDPVELVISSQTISFCYSLTVNPVQPAANASATSVLSILSLNACALAAPSPGAHMRKNIASNSIPADTRMARGAGAVLALLCMAGCMTRRRRGLPRLVAVAVIGLLGAVLAGTTGCSSSSYSSGSLTPGTYTLTVTGTDTINTATPSVSTNFTLIVH